MLFGVEKYRIRYLPFTGGKYKFAQGKDVPHIPDRLQRNNSTIWTVAVYSVFTRFGQSFIFSDCIIIVFCQSIWSCSGTGFMSGVSALPQLSRQSVRKMQVCSSTTQVKYFVNTLYPITYRVMLAEQSTELQHKQTRPTDQHTVAGHPYSIWNNNFSNKTIKKLHTLTHLSLLFSVSQWPSSIPVSLTVTYV